MPICEKIHVLTIEKPRFKFDDSFCGCKFFFIHLFFGSFIFNLFVEMKISIREQAGKTELRIFCIGDRTFDVTNNFAYFTFEETNLCVL